MTIALAMRGEEQLVEDLKKGDPSAWDQAFECLYPCAFHAARHPAAGLDIDDAQDAAIDALAQLVQKIDTVKNSQHLKALAVTIATRTAISMRRKQGAGKRGADKTDSLDRLKEQTPGGFEAVAPLAEAVGPAELLELKDLLDQAMAGLDSLTRDLLHDSLVAGMSYRDMSRKHKTPMGTVGVKLARGLKVVRAGLEKSPRLMKELAAFLR